MPRKRIVSPGEARWDEHEDRPFPAGEVAVLLIRA
jgi:hypothetical protein